MEPIILELYSRFLTGRADEELWQFAVPEDEMTANLLHANYMSAADLTICQSFDIASLHAEPGYDAKKSLHEILFTLCPPSDAEEAA